MSKIAIPNFAAKPHWEKIHFGHHHGIVVPLFSLHSKNSLGIGEYLDLLPMIDFVKRVGFDTLQLLPLNDTGGLPSPYSSLTANGLNPIHLSLDALPFKELHPAIHKPKTSDLVDYEKVTELKSSFLQAFFQKAFPKILEISDFKVFCQKNNSWLHSYALYRSLRDYFKNRPFDHWVYGKEKITFKNASLLNHELKASINYYTFLQFLCFKQLENVKQYADEKGVLIKGDIPILLSKESADVFENPDLFKPGVVAGAPPDQFSDEGQYWGFPVYDWQSKFEKVISFWKTRLNVQENLYHLYRLDHLVGLFRIWAIKEGEKANQGTFLPKDPSLWIPTGKKILDEFLKSSKHLPIAEDLGVVPDEVRATLQSFGIPGTKVLRWEREGLSGSFRPLNSFSNISMTTVSTHDTETLKGWAKTTPEDFKAFCKDLGFSHYQQHPNEALLDILLESHHTSSFFHINLIQEYLSFLPEFAKKNPLEERVNDPANANYPNWRFRIKPSVEELSSSKNLINLMNKAVLS